MISWWSFILHGQIPDNSIFLLLIVVLGASEISHIALYLGSKFYEKQCTLGKEDMLHQVSVLYDS